MSEGIELRFALAEVDELAVSRHLMREYFGAGVRFVMPGIVLSAVFVLSAVAHLVIGIDMLSPAGIAGLYVVGIAFIIAGLVNRRMMARLNRDIRNSPIRHAPEVFVVGPEGVTRGGLLFPWAFVQRVSCRPEVTLLCVSPREYVPLLHSALPADVTPEQLRKRIEAWREGATGAA